MKSIKLYLVVMSFSIMCFSSGFAQNSLNTTKEFKVKTTNQPNIKLNIQKINSFTNNDHNEISLTIYLEQSINEMSTLEVKYSTLKPKDSNVKNLDNKNIIKLELVKTNSKSLVRLKFKKEI